VAEELAGSVTEAAGDATLTRFRPPFYWLFGSEGTLSHGTDPAVRDFLGDGLATWSGNADDGEFDFLTDTGYPGFCLDNVGKGEDWMTISVETQVGWPGAPSELEKRL